MGKNRNENRIKGHIKARKSVRKVLSLRRKKIKYLSLLLFQLIGADQKSKLKL